MKNKKPKRVLRMERKKKKMTALLKIQKLNESDEMLKKTDDKVDAMNITDLVVKKRKIEDDITTPKLGPSGKPQLSGQEFYELKKLLRERKLKLKQTPAFRLREMGYNASLNIDLENRIPLFLTDIQQLVMYSQLGHHSPYSPARWCALEKFNRLANTTVLIIDNISIYDVMESKNEFNFLSSTFDVQLEILTATSYNSDLIKDFSMVPLTSTQMKKFINEYGDLDTAVIKSTEVFDILKNLFPTNTSDNDENQSNNLPQGDKFPRTQLLLSGWQMVEENFPLPIRGLMERKYPGYVLTKDSYKPVTPQSRMYGIDCEMCLTTTGDSELTRVSIVDEDLNTFYDTLVKPRNKITNYLTKFSGITPKMMRNVQTRLEDVQRDLRKLLPEDAILVGQSLSNDLHALKMMHPYIIDTSIIYNLTGNRQRKTKLKILSSEFLSENIQSGYGHCSTEDSAASLKLVQLKLQKSIYFGDAVMGNVNSDLRHYPELGTSNYATSMLKQVTKVDKNALVVGSDEIARRYKFYVDKGEDSTRINKKIQCLSEVTSDAVMGKIHTNMDNYSLIIGHIDGKPLKYSAVDGFIKDLHEKIRNPGLIIVLFTGHDCANGGCFIKVKTNN